MATSLVPTIDIHTRDSEDTVVNVSTPPASSVPEQLSVPTHHATSMLLDQLYALLPLSQELTSTRVLDVEKADDPDDQEIRGTLRVVNLVEAPEFVALSYIWGTFNIPAHTISCGMCSIKVTSNC
jgi:hypothetical protein